ncbi:MAG TPA: GTP-binding protein [Kofleriaceae bacterium]|nr:GTP-binding protein [Kofleriaceae bacterium]
MSSAPARLAPVPGPADTAADDAAADDAALLAEHGDHELLRLVVVGSVDDGKSTLIGRLLYECDGLFDDQIAAARKASKGGELDLSLFTDGLLAEREQGITIDVAYRYLTARAFGRRKLIIADTPGHVQYTRNMATGASTADAAVILVDARQGVLAQTRRHATIAGLLGIPYLAVAINKMDLVGYDRATFERLAAEVTALTARLGFAEVRCFPISAVRGDNVTEASARMPWHDRPLLSWLVALPHQARQEEAAFRFVVQQVLRPDQDLRLLAGRVASGSVRVGDTVTLLPSGRAAKVARIATMNGDLEAARAPLSVAIALDQDVDVGRGDVLAGPEALPETGAAVDADLVWLGERPLAVGRRYLLKLGARTVPAQVEAIHHRLDLDTLREVGAAQLEANDIGRVRVAATRAIVFDRYRDNRATGAFVLIDPEDHSTIAAGMVREAVRPAVVQATPPAAPLAALPATPAPGPPATPAPPALAGAPSRAAALLDQVQALSADDLLWLSGYAAGLAAGRRGGEVAAPVVAHLVSAAPPQPATPAVTVLYGTHTGTSRALAERLARRLGDGGATVRLVRASDYEPRDLAKERVLFVVVATHGDGDPADDTRALHDFVLGRRAPRLPELRFAVLGLGDSSYPKFCHVARLLDDRLAALGGRRLRARGECDVEVEAVAAPWLDDAVRLGLAEAAPARGDGVVIPLHAAPAAGSASIAVANAAPPAIASASATRAEPAPATVLASQAITARGANKRVRHLELAIDEARLAYQPGDSLAIWPANPPELVDDVLAAVGATGDEPATRDGRERPVRAWLTDALELTRLARPFLAAHAARSRDAGATALADALTAGHDDALAALVASHQVIDILTRFPAAWTAAELVAALRPLAPRSYSIASSLVAVPGEAHLTVGVVEDVRDGRRRAGCASDLLARAADGDVLRAFVEPNPAFRLPAPDADVIMIGPGTGVAPFRGFVQEREATGARGRSWLFFGEQHRRSQFLYQLEWQRALARGVLTRMDVAFSRDQPHKIYVQDRLAERGAELHAWLEGGAHVYVCGDARRMAPAVDAALAAIARRHGGLDEDGAADWLAALRAGGRYHRDVY